MIKFLVHNFFIFLLRSDIFLDTFSSYIFTPCSSVHRLSDACTVRFNSYNWMYKETDFFVLLVGNVLEIKCRLLSPINKVFTISWTSIYNLMQLTSSVSNVAGPLSTVAIMIATFTILTCLLFFFFPSHSSLYDQRSSKTAVKWHSN